MVLYFLIGYLAGSIPFGLLLTKACGMGDIRSIGSGNIGATNVLRTGNKKLAALTLFLDAFKGAIVILALGLYQDPYHALILGLGAILGHCFPVWLKFKGGKGVATALGVLLAAVPFTGLIACLTWLMSFLAARISSLAALTAMLIAPIITLIFYGSYAAAVNFLISLLVFIRHKDNIKRLMKGEEPRVERKAQSEALNETERLAWLRLFRTENVGPITFKKLVSRYGSAVKALEAIPELSKRGGRTKPLKVPSIKEVEREHKALSKIKGRILTMLDEDYPDLLAQCDDAPPVLSVIGNTELLQKNCIAMVGARNASLNGRKFAEKLARDLGQRGQIIVSGLARGIDTAAHIGSMATGTVAVVAGGIDVVYPEENHDLYKEIAARGLLIAESPLGQKPFASSFPQRNRIVSGLSKGAIVVEATLKSGSLITARLAGEQGRDVYAVPGHPMDPRASGPNALIRDGATLIRNADDLLENLVNFSRNALFDVAGKPEFEPLTEESDISPEMQDQLLSHMSFTAVTVDELIRTCHLSISAVQTILLDLELAGRIERLPGGRVRLLEG